MGNCILEGEVVVNFLSYTMHGKIYSLCGDQRIL